MFTSLMNMVLAIAECYEVGVYSVTLEGHVTVTNEIRFGEIRRKQNARAVASLYADGSFRSAFVRFTPLNTGRVYDGVNNWCCIDYSSFSNSRSLSRTCTRLDCTS
jgi:hypothetical protein